MEALLAFLPYALLFLLCPLMMLFMHRGGAHDDGHAQGELDDRAELARRLGIRSQREVAARARKPARRSVSVVVFGLAYRPFVARAAGQVLHGRRIDPSRPEAGRFLGADVTAFLRDMWRRVPEIAAEEDFATIPTLGNRHNVFLAVLTIAGYQALLKAGLGREYAIELFADIGWNLYERMVKVPMLPARVLSRDPQRRMETVLRMLMRFPFSAPGRPGYEVTAWSEPGRFITRWTYCAPLGFVQRYVRRHGDNGETEAFYQSWCLYDWPAADLLAGGRAGDRGHYERPHTLSRGDSVCDMCWYATRPISQPDAVDPAS